MAGDDRWIDVEEWSDIVAIAAGNYHIVGLKTNGTVVASGRNDDGECDVSEWRDIVAIAAGDGISAGLRSDGTVVTTGKILSGCSSEDLTGVTAIAVGLDRIVVLKAHG